jgi:hypothetical protein
VVEVAEHEWRAADGKRWIRARGERLARVDDVDGAERESLIDIRFLAQRRGWKNLDLVAAVGAFLDFIGGPERPLVIWLTRFVHVRPLEFGLCTRRACEGGKNHRCRNRGSSAGPLQGLAFHALSPLVLGPVSLDTGVSLHAARAASLH